MFLRCSGDFFHPSTKAFASSPRGEAGRVVFPGDVLRDNAVFVAEPHGPLPRFLAVGRVAELVGLGQVVGEILGGALQLLVRAQIAAPLLPAKLVRAADDQLLDPRKSGPALVEGGAVDRGLTVWELCSFVFWATTARGITSSPARSRPASQFWDMGGLLKGFGLFEIPYANLAPVENEASLAAGDYRDERFEDMMEKAGPASLQMKYGSPLQDEGTIHEQPRQSGRHHPHLPEVRSRRVSQSDHPAARPGFARLRASAPLRQHAPPHRGRAGPRRPHRPQPDPRPGAEPRSLDGDAPPAQAEDPRNLRDRPGARPRRTTASIDLAEQDQPAREAGEGLSKGRARGAAPRPGTAVVSQRQRAGRVRPAAAATDRAARREVPGRRAGEQV